jgi:PAS domain S-box-containing protein
LGKHTGESVLSPKRNKRQVAAPNPDDPHSIFSGEGELARLMCAFDWSKTALGPVESWPQSLRTSVSICLASKFPIVLYWGPECVVLYNDAYSEILGSKHPWALGQTCRVCWAEIWDTIGPMLDGVVKTGKATWSDDLLLMLHRFGYPEECYFSFSFSPVRVETGGYGGVFTAVIETTEKVIGERRLRTLRELAARTVDAKSEQDTWQIAGGTLSENPHDVPFAILCEVTGEGFRVAATAGISGNHALIEELCQPESELFQKAMQVVRSGQRAELEDLSAVARSLPLAPWGAPPNAGLLLPIAALGQGSSGILLAAVSPAKALDEGYYTFFDLLAGQIATSIADTRAYEEERRRAESLAKLDRAKTLFFSNISHELRTPLSLVLGPTESALSSPERALQGADLEMVHRNELRLLKLVNTLLDFSRIEAGRVQATYEAVDLSFLTANIASAFRSAMERAGLRFLVHCMPIGELVYVDREMWEKIVLNLLSNAFKFTFTGEIEISLKRHDQAVELTVRDTGTGIPENELPRIFERFHRIEKVRARTYEGTGIGLALVQELVKLHGGSIRVESTVGSGSSFHVTIPTGTAHLPQDRIQGATTQSRTGISAEAYVEEAQRWLPVKAAEAVSYAEPDEANESDSAHAPQQARQELVVIADDNADMREYLGHLLGRQYRVHAVSDGAQAVAATRQLRPALILADVMMPELDGFGMLQAIRGDDSVKGTPVILLSARAGEESRVEGLKAGADDYLVKPFTARELMARVGTHIKMANLRLASEKREASLRATAELERGRLQELLAQAPAAIGLLNGPEHRWVYVNQEYVRLTGRNSAEDFLGKSLLESLPELETQTFPALLDEVYRTGKPYFGHEMKASLNRSAKGLPDESYWDFVYQPMRNAEGQVEGILVHAVEVTDRVKARKAIEESERKYRDLAETASIALHWVGPDGTILWANRAELDLLGYSAEEYIGRNISEFHVDAPVIDDILNRLCRGERLREYEARLKAKDGSIRHVIIDSSVLFEDERFIHTRCFTRDVTQRKNAEKALRESEQRLRVVTEATPIMIWMSGTDKLCYYFNRSWLEFVGRTLEQEMGNGWAENVHPDDFDRCLEVYVKCFDARQPFEMEYRLRHHTGQYRWILDHGVPRFAPDGTFEGYVGGCLDIHEQKEAAEKVRAAAQAVRESEGRFRALVNASSYVVYRMSPDWSEMRQLDGRGFISDTTAPTPNWINTYIHPDDQPTVWRAIRRAIETKSLFELEHRVRRVDGTLGWTHSRAVPILDSQGEIVEWFGAASDVTARKTAEEARRQLAAIVESSDDAIISKNLDGIVTSWNHQAERLFGYSEEEMIGKSILMIIPPELHRDEDMILSKIRKGEKIDHFETVRVTKTGERLEVSLSISPVRDEQGNIVGAAKIARDIRESKKIERTLRTTEKLAAAGRLAATVAHEINNPLEAITNLVYLAQRDLEQQGKVAAHLEAAKRELDRVAHITRQTLGFYRDTSSPVRFNVAEVLDDLLRLYERRIESKEIHLTRQYKDHAEVVGLTGEIRQAFSNLLTNAMDATAPGGSLTVKVRKSRHWGQQKAQGVRITVADSGSGISPEHRRDLFQPFFTTKADVGTGLGLWITRGIIEKHGGTIRVRSRTGQKHGTSFSIFLPFEAKFAPERLPTGRTAQTEMAAEAR